MGPSESENPNYIVPDEDSNELEEEEEEKTLRDVSEGKVEPPSAERIESRDDNVQVPSCKPAQSRIIRKIPRVRRVSRDDFFLEDSLEKKSGLSELQLHHRACQDDDDWSCAQPKQRCRFEPTPE